MKSKSKERVDKANQELLLQGSITSQGANGIPQTKAVTMIGGSTVDMVDGAGSFLPMTSEEGSGGLPETAIISGVHGPGPTVTSSMVNSLSGGLSNTAKRVSVTEMDHATGMHYQADA